MAINKKIVCSNCTGEFEIEPVEDFPILFCPSCGVDLDTDEWETSEGEEEPE